MAQTTSGPAVAQVTAPDRAAPLAVRSSARTTPLTNQAVIAAVSVVAAVCSVLLPWLTVTNAPSMWAGTGLALLGLAFTGLLVARPGLARFELLVPALDFVAIGLLRFGTGDARSPFLAAVLLPLIWIAARPGRLNIVYPLVGTAATFLVPMFLGPTQLGASEVVRLVFVLVIFTAVAGVTNELARQGAARLRSMADLRRQAEAEISQAALVQRSLLPVTAADIPAQFTVRGVCLPTRSVGGDFYDWFPTSDGAAFTLGDVMGKGVGAGMIAAVVRSVLRSSVRVGAPDEAVSRTATGLDVGLDAPATEQFTTCFHLHLSTDGVARWVDAGHGLTLLLRADGSHTWLRSSDLPIGVGTSWTTQETVLRPGDVVLSVSDGVLDLFGDSLAAVDRFAEFAVADPDPDHLVERLEERGRAGHNEDDVTVLAIRYDPEPEVSRS
ncbi:PP2C family protein-serine/threonine phosphatase [Curtobacterium sp. MCBD17_032]|uniref:PP2C family protein-serine/threonine phosphatase n=1 Tax=Curtobacterium sp. MCBD17_032 TaxID=2175659 RepID=UPI000DA88A25|nr:PP2C family protein-serine/threonine phosphatase [Curtobacterium sp. MCBD17_032]PZE86991.1 regulator [Curtobacterium sp. MCBD17_032]